MSSPDCNAVDNRIGLADYGCSDDKHVPVRRNRRCRLPRTAAGRGEPRWNGSPSSPVCPSRLHVFPGDALSGRRQVFADVIQIDEVSCLELESQFDLLGDPRSVIPHAMELGRGSRTCSDRTIQQLCPCFLVTAQNCQTRSKHGSYRTRFMSQAQTRFRPFPLACLTPIALRFAFPCHPRKSVKNAQFVWATPKLTSTSLFSSTERSSKSLSEKGLSAAIAKKKRTPWLMITWHHSGVLFNVGWGRY